MALFAALCAIPAMPLAAQDEPAPVRYLVDDARVEADRADYKPLNRRVPNLCHGENCGGPTIDPRGLVNLADYPIKAWNEKREGRVEARLYFSEDDRILRCAIMISSEHDDLDQATCARLDLVTRYVANAAQPRPDVAEFFDFAFDWEIKQPEFPDTIVVTSRLIMGKDGQEKECELLEMSGPVPERLRSDFERRACPRGLTRAMAPYRDEAGNPIEKSVTLTYQVTVEDVEN